MDQPVEFHSGSNMSRKAVQGKKEKLYLQNSSFPMTRVECGWSVPASVGEVGTLQD